jgi:type II restriction enzyme
MLQGHRRGCGRHARARVVRGRLATSPRRTSIIRLLDLALGASAHATRGLFLVAPDDREDEVRAQLARPAFQRVADLRVRYLPYGELERNRDAMARFGSGLKAIEAVARTLG